MDGKIRIKDQLTDGDRNLLPRWETNIHTVFVTVGTTHSGKTHFVKHVLIPALRRAWTEARVVHISTDDCRRELLGDPNCDRFHPRMMQASHHAFELEYTKLELATSYPTHAHFVIFDSTGIRQDVRDKVVEIAHKKNRYHVEMLVFDLRSQPDRWLPRASSSSSTSVCDPQHGEVQDSGREERKAMARARTLLYEQRKRIRTDVLPAMGKIGLGKSIQRRHKMGQPVNELEITIVDLKEYLRHRLPADYKYLIVGDTHGCFEEFQALLQQAGLHIASDGMLRKRSEQDHAKSEQAETGRERGNSVGNRCALILVGDIIDKGPQVREMINFVYQNTAVPPRSAPHAKAADEIVPVYCIRGNHEIFAFRRLSKEETAMAVPEDFVREWFGTSLELESDLELREKFLALYEAAHPFLWCDAVADRVCESDARHSADGEPRSFIVTHAPCEDRFLGKLDVESRVRQSNYSAKRLDKQKDILGQLVEAGLFHPGDTFRNSWPVHVFGHLPLTSAYVGWYKPRVGARWKPQSSAGANGVVLVRDCTIALDTGCVEGNLLTAVWLTTNNLIAPRVLSVPSRSKRHESGEGKQHDLFRLHGHRDTKKSIAAPVQPEASPTRGEQTCPVVFGEDKAATLEEKDAGRICDYDPLGKLEEQTQQYLRQLAAAGANFLPSTISPARSDVDRNEFESIRACLEDFRSEFMRTRPKRLVQKGVVENPDDAKSSSSSSSSTEEVGCDMRLTLQPKWMGSRCVVYLHLKGDGSYALSRNGHRLPLPRSSTSAWFDRLKTALLSKKSPRTGLSLLADIEWVVLDGELLPWSALGRKLIDHHYRPAAWGLLTEVERLESSGFELALSWTDEELAHSDFWDDKRGAGGGAKRDKLVAKYGQQKTQDAVHHQDYTLGHRRPMAEERGMALLYEHQVNRFGFDTTSVSFEPFSVLKFRHTNGSEYLPASDWDPSLRTSSDDNEENDQDVSAAPRAQARAREPWMDEFAFTGEADVFRFVEDLNPGPALLRDRQVVVDLADWDKSLAVAQAFFDELTCVHGMEGMVVKPHRRVANMVPARKVRSKDYLTLIYGYDYQWKSNYSRLLRTKQNVARKDALSTREHELSMALGSKISLSSVTSCPSEFIRLTSRFRGCETSEQNLDARW